jgi:signal transduction histidine kinase
MQIRTKLTLQFLLIGGMIMVIASLAIYLSSSQFRKDDFYNRLRTRARITARILLDAQETEDGRISKIEQDYPSNLQNEKIIIINYLNDTIYSNDERGDIKIRNDILERVRLYDKVFYKQGQYEVLGTLYTNSRYRFVVIAGAIDSDGIMHLKKLETILIVVCFLSFVLFSVAGWVFAGRALKPIANVVKRVEDISFTSMNLRVPEGNGTDEIGKLAKTFNSMLERIQTSINVQKDFIANASHELRTPLTSINGQIEVLLLKNRSSEEYKNALKSVLDDIKSLTDLANKLLLMACTGPETRISYNNKIRTDEILWQIREEMKKYKPDFIINISFDDSLTDSDQMLVAGDEYLLKTAFSNIIENACKYSDDHSVEISLEQYFNKVHITFKDRGIGIDEKDLKMIFEPFYRASNAISIPGTGIGLSLVNQILRNHNGTIELTSVKSKGTTVKISLPSLLP